MPIYYLLLFLQLLGLGIALYLAVLRTRKELPYCVIGKGCGVVLGSKFNRIFGVGNDIMGSIYYGAMIVLGCLLKFDLGPSFLWIPLLKLTALSGFVMACLLLFVQWKVLESWCFWCVTADANAILIAVIIFLYF
jgi:uncharacterized membrane protein